MAKNNKPKFPKSPEDTEFRGQLRFKHRELTLLRYLEWAVALLKEYGIGNVIERSKLINLAEKLGQVSPLDPKKKEIDQRGQRNDEFDTFRRKLNLGGKCPHLGKHQFQLSYQGKTGYLIASLCDNTTQISKKTFEKSIKTFERKKREISRAANSFAIPWPSEYSVVTLAGQKNLESMKAAFIAIEEEQTKQHDHALQVKPLHIPNNKLNAIEIKLITDSAKKWKEEAAKAGIIV